MKRTLVATVFALVFTMFSVAGFAGVFPVSSVAQTAACGLVPSYKDANFCSEFKTVTQCYCDARFPSKLQPVFCPSVAKIYSQAIALYHTLDRLCEVAVRSGQSSGVIECENQWSCAVGSNVTGHPCPADHANSTPCPGM